MTRGMIGWIRDIVSDPDVEPAVHFHQGPESTPAVCYDTRCARPRLDVRTC